MYPKSFLVSTMLCCMVATTQAQTAETKEITPDSASVIWLDELDASSARELEWEALIPQDWRPETLFDEADIEALDDADPRAQDLLDKLKRLWDEAPVVTELAGQRVRLPGFVVPLEMDATSIEQFLLVPYFGACIHVPPPPANQIVHVVMRDDTAFDGELFDTVWVTGTMNVERLSHELGDAGYRLDDASVTPYDIEYQ
jgi:hypothetical protein